jgi:pyruvate dehydrogenase E1 component alpha subunit
MAENGELSAEDLDAVDAEVMTLIEDSVVAAKAAPRPTPDQLLEDVYVNYV